MDKRNDYEYDWDDQYYGTGPTEPPKDHGGFVAFLLMLLIFLTGIVTVLGILNIKMFHELQDQQGDSDEMSIAFAAVATAETEDTTPTEVEVTVPNAPFVSMSIQSSPEGVENIPTEGGISLQDIYTKNIDSVVSISCQSYSSSSSGTGVILSSDGYIVTNSHVVEGATVITVQLTDDRTFSARVVGSDDVSDLRCCISPPRI